MESRIKSEKIKSAVFGYTSAALCIVGGGVCLYDCFANTKSGTEGVAGGILVASGLTFGYFSVKMTFEKK
jgi:hypothetical protein